MTSYQGGKQKIGKQIFQCISNIESKLVDTKLDYIEPFCGMCGVVKHFAKKNTRQCYVTDINPDIIEMWKAFMGGWIPSTECTLERYNNLKNQTAPSAERGFYGVVCSFGGQFFEGTYRTETKTHNFIEAGIRGITKACSVMKDVQFLDAKDYRELDLKSISNSKPLLIYCDPPYKNNQLKNKYFRNFNHDVFWETMRAWSEEHIVIISEKEAPDDFISVWEKPYQISYTDTSNGSCKNTKRKYTEKLFIYKSYNLDEYQHDDLT